MHITLLYFEDCPNWLVASAHLDAIVAEHPEISVTRHVVDTAEEAEKTQFRGSPSFLINGVDAFAGAEDPVGLSCRVYQTPSGPAGSPTREQLRAAIEPA